MSPQQVFKRGMSTFFHSFRFRLVLWFTAILSLVLFLFSAFIYFSQVQDWERDSLGQLERRLDRLQEILRTSLAQRGGQLILPDNLLQESDALALVGPTGQVLASYGNFPTQNIFQAAVQTHQNQSGYEELYEHSISWVDKESGYAYAVAPIFGESGQTSLLVLGTPLDPEDQVKGLLTTLVVGSLLTLAVATGGGFWLADRAMRPVRTITYAARSISETDLERRINLNSRDELGELARTFDNMLERLRSAFERQRQFVADAGHELRTPLTIVNLETSRVLAARRSPQEYERALRVIQSENDFMSHLVNDLLTLARMDSGQVPLGKSPLDLSDVVVEAIERLSSLAARKHVALEAGDLPEAHMLGDRQSLLQMVSNLIENGIKYTDGDQKKVYIETGLTDGYVWVRVSDNGPGIAPEHQPHLFDRFYRVDQARTRDIDEASESPSGSGLGLSITQWIARAHEGEIEVESTPGKGSSFKVRFEALKESST